ncbi:Ltp family lipoprotein [Helcobacillus massiliensis]|uniref:Ltp family lipoprotein n=1 Tax=Helcobacillus massiliensis TaxID=521392 RepID=UPI00255383B7|nr:Ltp family lipoprotein [Helcobacillus massiliensis]MDK7742645.1 Ltp family lipoprotein [Helcobacillus massiliensis]WOO92583.1 Ltp family lipoprotein [Helcobacillus massiliensis]
MSHPVSPSQPPVPPGQPSGAFVPAEQPKKSKLPLILGGSCCGILLFGGLIAGCSALVFGGGSPAESPSTTQSAAPEASATPEEAKPAEKETSSAAPSQPEKKAESKPAEKPAEKKQDDVPVEHRNALRSAQNYLDVMPMSKQALFDQLTSEHADKFSKEAAQYAIDNIDADWKENAAKEAKIYQDELAMSRDAIYELLVSEYDGKYTPEEAKYGVDQLDK